MVSRPSQMPNDITVGEGLRRQIERRRPGGLHGHGQVGDVVGNVVGDPGIEPGMGLPGGVTVRCRTLQLVALCVARARTTSAQRERQIAPVILCRQPLSDDVAALA